jgi:hypothetical protein
MSCPFESLAKYKDILGVPKKGFHEKRIGPYAFNDTFGTIFIALILTIFFKPLQYINKTKSISNYINNFIVNLIFIFVLGELLHYIFCVDTAFILQMKKLFK